jgi:plastocyanin
MKKGITAIVVVVIIAIAAWYIFGNKNSNNSSLYGNNNGSSSTQTPANNNNTSNNSSASNTQPETTNKVTIANMAFTPPQITVNKGDTVTWANNDSIAHTVTSDTGSELGSGDIQPGSTYSHTFNTAGSFQYHCSIHPSMRGTIVVK